ncbi:MAG: tetratricopeptide repeat protein [Treponema sp.]|jgi:tetratricopeptide (TPR) repeat protein|nr:tetratricopeptide repeat protein [Treponema sp.]
MSAIEMQKIAKLIKEGDYKIAEELLKVILEELPHNRTAHFLFGMLLAKTGMLEEAETEFFNLVKDDRRDAEALCALAIVYRWQGKLKDALGTFNEAIDLDPTRYEFYRYVGDIQILEKNLKAAFMAYAKAIECNPDFASAYNNLGIVYFEMNEINKALNAFQQAISRESGNEMFHYNYAIALEANGQLQEAVHEYEIAVGITPYWTSARLNFGSILAKLEQLDRAGSAFDIILDEDPFNADGWNNMGIVLAKQGYREEAIRHFNRALEERSGYDLARRNLDSVKNDADPKVDFAVAGMILDQEIDILFTQPKPDFKPLSGDFMGIEIPHLVTFMNYLKEIINFLPEQQKMAFNQSDIRIRMEYILNTFMGHRGILREIQDLHLKQQPLMNPRTKQLEKTSPVQESAGQPDGGEAADGMLNAVEIADFLTYLGTLSSNLPDPALTKYLTEKIKTVVSAMR